MGQSAPTGQGLTPKEIALSNPQSETIVSVSGALDQVLDLTTDRSLKDFVKLISKFKLSEELKKMAMGVGDQIDLITTPKALRETLLEENWRIRPVQYQVPANSQIFGQLIYSSGIQGILYPSKQNGKNCLAIYTSNFKESDSYIEFVDPQPDDRIPTKIDSNNYEVLLKKYKEIISH